MKKVSIFLSRHKITSLFFVLLMLGSLAYASFTLAKSGNVAAPVTAVSKSKGEYCTYYQLRRYYSDASHTTQVGFRIWTCDAGVGGSGTVTQFFEEELCECFPEQ